MKYKSCSVNISSECLCAHHRQEMFGKMKEANYAQGKIWIHKEFVLNEKELRVTENHGS